MTYNPFNKPIHEHLDLNDLNALIGRVAEGYYVEYKGEFPENEKIGRSIASFANTYGGWYIVGVKTDRANVANEICGFDLEKCPDAISKVREIARTYIDPVPVFNLQFLQLSDTRGILVVYIPGEQDTPFISKNGRIYRRTHDASEPIPENNRYAVDKLYEASKQAQKRFNRFCQDERGYSKSESNGAWLSLYIVPKPAGLIQKFEILETEYIKELIKRSQGLVEIPLDANKSFASGSIPFTAGQTSFGSIILRQVDPTRVAFNSCTMEFFVNGSWKCHIPVPFIQLFGNETTTYKLQNERVVKIFDDYRSRNNDLNLEYLSFIDIKKLLITISILFCFYLEWLGNERYLADFQLATKVNSVWRSVPFYDGKPWADQVEKVGIPIIQKDIIRIPEKFGGIWKLSGSKDEPLWASLCQIISIALGLPLGKFVEILFDNLVDPE